MAQGLQPDSKTKEVIEKIDEHKAIRYKVVEEVIDLNALRAEKERLEAQLAEKEPSEEELIEMGRNSHFYYTGRQTLLERLEEINKWL